MIGGVGGVSIRVSGVGKLKYGLTMHHHDALFRIGSITYHPININASGEAVILSSLNHVCLKILLHTIPNFTLDVLTDSFSTCDRE